MKNSDPRQSGLGESLNSMNEHILPAQSRLPCTDVDREVGTLDLTSSYTSEGLQWAFVPLTKAKPLFQHPHLQTLTLRSAIFRLAKHTHVFNDIPTASTGLEELNLHSCMLSSQGLANLLRLPRNLKHLTIGAPFSFSYRSNIQHLSSAHIIAAMSPVYETLECFRIIQAPSVSAGLNWAKGPASGLENLTAVRYLDIAGYVVLKIFSFRLFRKLLLKYGAAPYCSRGLNDWDMGLHTLKE
jgi:hypothetical protein